MTLLHAFRTAALLCGEPDIDAERQEAARVLMDEMSRLAARVTWDTVDPGDVVQDKLMALLQAGPRGVRDGEPDSDAGVRNWLARVLRRQAIDQHRKSKPHAHSSLEDWTPEMKVSANQDVELIQRHLDGDLLDRLVDFVAATLRADGARNLREAVDELRRLRDGHATMADLIAVSTSEAAVHQRHTRARKKLLLGLPGFCGVTQLDHWESEAVTMLVASLRQR